MITPSINQRQRFLGSLQPITVRGKSKTTSDHFSIYNPDFLSNYKNDEEFEGLKEQVTNLKNEIRKKKKDIYNIRKKNNQSKEKLYEHLACIEKILIKINDENANKRVDEFLHGGNEKKGSNMQLAYLLKNQTNELNTTLNNKEKEIQELKTSEKGYKFINMNEKMITKNEELEKKAKRV